MSPPWSVNTTSPCSGEEDTPYRRLSREIAQEERQLRMALEARLRDYARLLQELASTFMSAELDAWQRQDPEFLARATPDDWRRLLAAATRRTAANGWPRPRAEGSIAPPEAQPALLPALPEAAQQAGKDPALPPNPRRRSGICSPTGSGRGSS